MIGAYAEDTSIVITSTEYGKRFVFPASINVSACRMCSNASQNGMETTRVDANDGWTVYGHYDGYVEREM